MAAADGRVRATGDDGKYAYGVWVAIDHGNNLVTLYAHLSKNSITVKSGQTVKKGEVIITGHKPDKDFLKLADLATEMKKVKHYFDKGQQAREGIEY